MNKIALKNRFIFYNKKLFSDLVLFFLFISLIFDPTGEFYKLKFISTFLSVVIFGLFYIFNVSKYYFTKKQLIYIFAFCIFLPIYGIGITLFSTDLKNFTDTSYLGFSLLIFLLIPILSVRKERFIKIFIISLRFLQLIVLSILLSFIIDGDSLGISQFFIDHKSMLMGFREYGGIPTYYIYFTASPLLIILVAYDSFNLINNVSIKNIFILSTSVLAIFLTGTRFNMLTAILIIPITFFLINFNFKYLILSSLLLIFIALFIFNNPVTSSFFSTEEDSNNVKIGYLETYLDIFSQNPKYLILGQGFNAHDWSMIFKNLLIKSNNEGTKTELTFIEMIRVFGIFNGILFNLMFFLMPVLNFRIYRKFNFVSISLIIYLLSSALNPYIFSTNGVLVFLLFLVTLNIRKNSGVILN